MEDQQLLKKAVAAAKLAYAPYSKFKVGAALLLKQGLVIQGCNVENASYGLTICAERNALAKAISEGYNKKQIIKIAVVADSKGVASPCGACRQVLIELANKNCPILLSNLKLTKIQQTTVAELLPFAFTEII